MSISIICTVKKHSYEYLGLPASRLTTTLHRKSVSTLWLIGASRSFDHSNVRSEWQTFAVTRSTCTRLKSSLPGAALRSEFGYTVNTRWLLLRNAQKQVSKWFVVWRRYIHRFVCCGQCCVSAACHDADAACSLVFETFRLRDGRVSVQLKTRLLLPGDPVGRDVL